MLGCGKGELDITGRGRRGWELTGRSKSTFLHGRHSTSCWCSSQVGLWCRPTALSPRVRLGLWGVFAGGGPGGGGVIASRVACVPNWSGRGTSSIVFCPRSLSVSPDQMEVLPGNVGREHATGTSYKAVVRRRLKGLTNQGQANRERG